MYKHTCIKPGCVNSYEDEDPDAYYCAEHVLEKQNIAKAVDEKLAREGPKLPRMSDLQRYDAAPKIRGFISAADLL